MEEGRPVRPVSGKSILAQTCEALNDAGARYLVIGGYACILHGYVRATTDVDILIERSLANARAVLKGLAGLGYGFAVEWTPEEILKRPITLIGDDPPVDVFTVAWSVKYETAVKRSSTFTVEGIAVPTVGIEDLIATKRTGRVTDAEDVEALEEIRNFRYQK